MQGVKGLKSGRDKTARAIKDLNINGAVSLIELCNFIFFLKKKRKIEKDKIVIIKS
jgi:hypothetical protein